MEMRVLEVSQVAPPIALNELSLPLTYFDLPLLLVAPPELLLFYKLPNINITQFMNSIIPQIKHSLSQTLQHFYPLAGNLIWSPQLNQPIIQYVDGDSILVTAVESNANFNSLSSYHARDVKDFQHLIPKLTPLNHSNSSNDESTKVVKAIPACALQITLFRDCGICLGATSHHAAADGRALAMFLTSWASVSRFQNTKFISSNNASLLPIFDRSVIKDVDNGLRRRYWQSMVEFIRSKSMSEQDCYNWLSLSMDLNIATNQVVATFVLNRNDIQRLGRLWASMAARPINDKSYPSRFELACAYIWICLARIPNNTTNVDIEEEISAISFVADYRARLDPPVPTTYFGNCMLGIKVSAKRRDIVGEQGIVVAVDTVMKELRGLSEALERNYDARLARLLSNANGSNRFDAISGSTQFGLYKLDFGWGRPKKVELISKARMNSISFLDCGHGNNGGIEICLVRDKDQVDAFALSFVHDLKFSMM